MASVSASACSKSETTKHQEEQETSQKSQLKDNNVEETHSLMENHSSRTNNGLSKPPDGGWGWFVVLASFLIHVITDGVTYSFGVFYLELLYYFEEGKGATAWIASILVGVTLCSGPISGSFVNKYGCRAVTIAGSILASSCLLASVWAGSIIMLYFTIGLGTGLGFGLIYLPAIVSVTCYFEKYRSLATGIAVCGSGLGTLVFAPCLESLISNYGWRGTMMICSGIVLNCIVLGAFFRPLETPISKRNHNSEGIYQELQSKEKFTNQEECSNKTNDLKNNIKFNVFDIEKEIMPISFGMRTALSQPVLITKVSSHYKQSLIRGFGSVEVTRCYNGLHHGSLENIRNYSKSLDVDHKEEVTLSDTYSKNVSKNIEIKKTENNMALSNKSENTRDVLEDIEDTSLLKNPMFILFTLSNFCTSIGFNVPYIYLLPQAEERGINKSLASYLLAIIGVANTLGRIILGYISDKPWINRLLVYNICLTICGIATIFSTLCTNFYTFAFYCIVYGFTAGAYVGLTSVILVDLLGLNRLTSSFGLLLLFQGFASLLGPPLSYALRSYPSYFGYGISGQTHDKNETKVINESANIGKELSPPTNANLNPNSNNIVTQPLQVDSKQSSLTSNANATDTQIKDTTASNAAAEAIKKEDSALPNIPINETTSANTLVDQNTPKNVDNDSKKVIEDSNTDSNIKDPVIISTTKPETTTTIKTSTTTTTSTTSTTTTAAPPVPLPTPKPGKWLLNGTNETCIIVSMAVQFNVSDYSDKTNQTTYKVFNLPDRTNETKVSGSCGKLEQSIVLQWNGTVNVTNTFTLHFSKNETTKQYHFHHLELNITEGNQTSMYVHNATLFSTGLSNSYRCLKEQNVTLDSNKTKGYLLISDLQFQAFKTDQNVNFGEVKDCKLDTPDIVPIAVGCALAVLVVIVLIAYLIGRKRSQSRGYLSM